jgi:sialate O-acetylesterase
MTLPCGWQQAGHNISGVFWFRREVFVPAAWAGRDLVLRLGACDKHDSTYFNNEPVGGLGMEIPDAWSTRRIYRVPGRHVRAGRNLVAVRVYSYMYQGGMIGPAAQMRLEPADEPAAAPVALDGDWRYRIEHDFGFVAPPVLSSGPGNHNSPHILFDSMIHPLLPYASRGVLWYQGEGNCERAAHYRALLPALIRDWRAAWNSPGLSFFFVQLANHGPRLELPGESLWAELRETQLEARTLPGTAMAVTIDIGDAADIHPVNKQEVGRRLALAARALIFGEKLVHSGPVLRSWAVEGGAVRLEFDSMGGGLATSDGRSPIGFAVAGRDRMFHCAGARIEGDTVVVRADEIPAPLAVRYAWADNPDCNLVNREGLPASPFRTDEWPGRTASCAS